MLKPAEGKQQGMLRKTLVRGNCQDKAEPWGHGAAGWAGMGMAAGSGPPAGFPWSGLAGEPPLAAAKPQESPTCHHRVSI